nr:MAG TPA: hypothetical protein [Caudoviricetes sp.]
MLHIHCRRTRLGDGSSVHGFQSSSLYQETQAFRCLQNPFKSA